MIQAVKNGVVNDAMLFSMLCLATHGSGSSVRRFKFGKVDSRKTILREHDAQYYGALEPEWQHLEVFHKLVKCRGGIGKVRSQSVLLLMTV